MIKNRILLASVLKPINDTRMYGKLGISLAKLPATEIHVVGFHAHLPPAPPNMFFHPIFKFNRLSPKRMWAPIIFFKLLWQISPQVIVVGTHELLLTSLIFKLLRRCKLIYDVRENYYLNLTSQRVYAPIVSRLLALVVRGIEKLATPGVTQFFLAEKSYAHQLRFVQSKFLILENKFQPKYPALPCLTVPKEKKIPTREVQLLYSGTISELYGVFRAIAFCNALNQVTPIYRLTIIGYCPQTTVLRQVQSLISQNENISLVGGDKLVPHHDILQAITQSHVGLLPYLTHPSTIHCLPTKLYEYIGHALPVIIQQNPLWQEKINFFKAGFAIDFNNINAFTIHDQLHNQSFYSGQDLSPAYWLTEEKKLLGWAQTTITGNVRKTFDLP